MTTHKIKTISAEFVFILSMITVPLIFVGFIKFAVNVEYWVILLFCLADFIFIHWTCSGLLKVDFKDDNLILTWIKKPFITRISDQRINFYEIKKWDNIGNHKGPDSLLVVLKNKKRIRIYFRIIAKNNNYGDFLQDFANWIEEQRASLKRNNQLNEKTAVNITESFFNSSFAKFINYFLVIAFVLDILLLIINPWSARLTHAIILVPLTIWGMFHFIYYQTYKKNE